jgi:hypothetical protein
MRQKLVTHMTRGCDAQAIEAMGYLESRIPLVIFGHSFGEQSR